MAPRYMSDRVTLLLAITVVLTFVISTASTKQCASKKTDDYVVKNIGIKLCQLKCAEHGQCASIEYNIETLTCHLLRDEPKIEETEGQGILESSHSNVPTGSCTSGKCSFGQRCLKTRSGKETCVQAPATVYDLFNASRDGDLERVKRILAEGHVDINMRRGLYSRTPLMAAARWGHRCVVDLLVGRGADVSLVDKDGNNILHLTCVGGDLETVKLILSLNVLDINTRGYNSGPPVMMAAHWGHRDVVEFLFGRGASMSLVDEALNNVLHVACLGGDLETVKLILSLNVLDINTRGGYYSRTPVMMAVLRRHRDLAEFLVGRGADISLVDSKGNNVLHCACFGRDLEVIKLILSLNVLEINAKNQEGQTAADVVRVMGRPGILDILVSRSDH